MMKRFTLAVAVVALMAGNANAQERARVYNGGYNGYGYQPGLSVYPGTGMYSLDYQNQRVWRHYGYTTPRRGRPGHPATRYNGVYGAPNGGIRGTGMSPQPWMFYYHDMYLSPYNIDSPIWTYGQ